MRHSVVWRDKALQRLAKVWMRATDKDAVNRAVNRADRLLATEPESRGRDYFGDRVLTVVPVWVLYAVRPDDRIVEVLDVGQPGIDLPHDDTP
jgi:hypothetical protein